VNLLVTAGPTQERIDPVRFLSNRSTGKMGYAIAAAAIARGHAVTLVSGPTHLVPPESVTLINVENAAEMAAAVHREAVTADVIIMAAAIADYRPKNPLPSKLKKGPGDLTLTLERTEDILAKLGKNKRKGQILVGFAAETDDLLANARTKLDAKQCDWVVANDVSRADRGFAVDANAVTLLSRDGHIIPLPLAPKTELAHTILGHILPPNIADAEPEQKK
jgi:phosphopantothenoylcysteine decarboxylase/phosphopantothenate--cysteine ligase